MHTPRVSQLSSLSVNPMATKLGTLASLALLAGALAGVAPQARADDVHTFLGAGVGAVAGAAIGQSMGGRNGAILGAGAGGLVGASIANQGYAQQRTSPMPAYAPNVYPATYYQQPVMRYQPPVVAWQPPPPQVQYIQPVNYYRQPVVTWQPPPQEYRQWREERHHYRHHDHGHYNDRY